MNPSDETLIRFGQIASDMVEKELGYPLTRATRTYVTHERDEVRSITIPFAPLRAVTRLVVDGRVWLDETVNPPITPRKGFGFTPWGVLRAPYVIREVTHWNHFFGEVEVDFESGYTISGANRDLPLAIEMAISLTVGTLLEAESRSQGIKSESVPGVYSIVYDTEALARTEIPAAAKAALRPYRIARLA